MVKVPGPPFWESVALLIWMGILTAFCWWVVHHMGTFFE